MEDLELIRRTCSGEHEAFADIVRRYQARVIRLCTSLLSDATLAEDAAQEIFLKAYRALVKFRGDSSFSTWLYRITANHCKDLLRKRAREKTQSWDLLLEKYSDQVVQFLAQPVEQKSTVEDREWIQSILSRLQPDYRIILTLREVQGLSYEELAETLHCSLNSVKARLRRARAAVQEQLRHFLPQTGV